MNKKLIALPAILLISGLALTGCSTTEDTESTGPAVEFNEDAVVVDMDGPENPFGESTDAAYASAENFLTNGVNSDTATERFVTAYNEATTEFAENPDIDPNILNILTPFSPAIDGANINVNPAQTSAFVPLFLYNEAKEPVTDLAVQFSTLKVDDVWLVDDVLVTELDTETSYVGLMTSLMNPTNSPVLDEGETS